MNDYSNTILHYEHPALLWLSDENFRKFNVEVARYLGSINTAVLLNDMIDRFKYHRKKEELKTLPNENGYWFFYTKDLCEERTTLTRKEQDTCFKTLKKLGIIDQKVLGLPAKRYFRLNLDKLNVFFNSQINSTTMSKKDKLGCSEETKCDVSKEQSGHNIYESKEKNLGKRESDPPKISFKEFVNLTQDEYDKLVEFIGKEQTEEMIESLNNFKGSTGKKYVSDYHTIRQWVNRDKKEGKTSKVTSPSNRKKAETAFQFQKSDSCYIELNQDSVAFIPTIGANQMPVLLKFSENGFEDQLNNLLRKYRFYAKNALKTNGNGPILNQKQKDDSLHQKEKIDQPKPNMEVL